MHTRMHTERLVNITSSFADYLKLTREQKTKLFYGTNYHDLGKKHIPKEILNKKEKLTEEELVELRKHPVYSFMMLEDIIDDKDVLMMTLHHHERVDGKGYPFGLEGDSIPDLVKILTICDSYEAMTTTRPYKEKMSTKEALIEIENCLGKQFDRKYGEKFIDFIKREHLILPQAQ